MERSSSLSLVKRLVERALARTKIGCSREYHVKIVIGWQRNFPHAVTSLERKSTVKVYVGYHAAKTTPTIEWEIISCVAVT